MSPDQLAKLPRTRRAAKLFGSRHYFTGKPCKHGHMTFRYTKYGSCHACLRERVQRQPEWYAEHTRIRVAEVRRAVRKARKKSCTDCGDSYPWYMMEFDHRDGRDEDYRGFSHVRSLKRLEEELEKCDLVCANCHRARTHFRRLAEQRKRRVA